MTKSAIKISKFLSFVLRHQPEAIGLVLDQHGWVETQVLLEKMKQRGFNLTLETLKTLVADNDKQRFAFSTNFTKIRANQGHSIKVDLALEEKEPPVKLYHGTAYRNLVAIQRKGLQKAQRHHVHLSVDPIVAQKVGVRHGKPIVLVIHAAAMYAQNLKFYQSANGIWLTDHVPTPFIDLL